MNLVMTTSNSSVSLVAPVRAVTVLEDRASVTRRGSARLAAGQHRLVIESIAPILADKTLTATASGGRVLDVRCERYLAPWRDPEATDGAADVIALRTELRANELARERALGRASTARTEADALRALIEAAYRDLAQAASRGVSETDAAGRLAELDTAEANARARLVTTELEADAHAAAITRLSNRVARAEREAGSEAARLVIDVQVDAPGDVTFAVGYVVPGAAWRPYHRAVLARAAGRVDWTTTACVWQATGEDWVDVELTFSLERASLGVEPPTFSDDEVRVRKRPDTVTVEAREHEQQTTGLGALAVPGIDDGGLGIVLVSAKATVTKDGQPHRIPVAGFTAPTQLSLVAVPLRSAWVHVRARIVNAGTAPLLAGPVDLIMASGYVGRAEVGFVAPGEKFNLGFGPEPDVRVHRTETTDREDAGLLGGWNTSTTKVAVRLSNLGSERRIVEVTERVPVSEVEQVEVVVAAADAHRLGSGEGHQVMQRAVDDTGIVTWTVELPAHGRGAVTLEYKLRSQRGVAGV